MRSTGKRVAVAGFSAVIDKYDEHADILRNSVGNREQRGHRLLLAKSDLAAERALEQGAEKLARMEFVLGL